MIAPFHVHVDKTGFPLIEIGNLDFLIAWLPVTKIQFEQFISDTPFYDDAWYQTILEKHTGRISPDGIGPKNYWNIFVTGILPAEAIEFADWMGAEYRLPSAAQWKEALTVLSSYPAAPEYVEELTTFAAPGTGLAISERAARICRGLDFASSEDSNQLPGTGGRRLCDQMMMRLGIVEYVYENSLCNTFAVWGQPNRRFLGWESNPIVEVKPTPLLNRNEGARVKQFGFRLIRSKT